MKTFIQIFETVPGKILFSVLTAFTLLNNGCATHGSNSVTEKRASGGITDTQIRDVVARVARHQLHPLHDGQYPSTSSSNALEHAKNAARPEGISWSYPWGVTLYGLQRSVDITGDKTAEQFALKQNAICAREYDWLTELRKRYGRSPEMTALEKKSRIHALMRLGNLDSCGAMGTEMLVGMMRQPGQVTSAEKEVVARIADWVVNKQDRLPDGTLWRSRSMGGTVWPDDLYMGGVFLAHWGEYTGQQKYIDDAANQIIHQAALEQDADGLWFHGYFMKDKQHAPFKWGRGNGWVTMALVETLSVMPKNDPLRPKLITILRQQIEGLKKVQAPDGMWRQVLDRPELWEETSCTAMFAYGIARAVNRGWIDESNMEMARKAFAGLAKRVTQDGVVKGTCQGTNIGQTLGYYLNRKRPDDDLHGRGVVMLAGTEILMADKQ